MKFIVFVLVLMCTSTVYAEYGSSRNYSSRGNYFPTRSYSNSFGGTDYLNSNGRVRSVPNIHGGFNYYYTPSHRYGLY